MDNTTFRALVVRQGEGKTFTKAVEEKSIADLPDGDVLIKVHYSSVNYKDGLSASGNRGVTRNFPHTPGIDTAGTIVHSSAEAWQAGDEVVVIGYDLGMNTAGGYGQYIRVPARWVVAKPADLTLQECMVYGTAGFTAAQSVSALIKAGVKPENGRVVVTGATGGVGSVAVAILAKLGYQVVAATGKLDQTNFLTALGAAEVIHRDEVNDQSGRPISREVWAGAIDTVGGNPLATLIKTTQYGGAVTCCGLVAGSDFSSSVFPFILRGVSLLGIDSVECPITERRRIWELIGSDWKLDSLNDLMKLVPLDQVSHEIDLILKGQQRGRVVVDLWN
ncbi:MAG: YhdH/YhfP family quinone oxidoreductase [Sphaerospermopsis sp. SIO1G2]|nr:YhdH/YhfP family quinone oxidoreductase [Sphaerospermopsis sp. SIO1G2]